MIDANLFTLVFTFAMLVFSKIKNEIRMTSLRRVF